MENVQPPSIQPPALSTLVTGTGNGRLPTTWEKNIPRILILLGSFVGAVGTWYTTNVVTDPETAQMIGTDINVPAVCSAIVGILGIIGGLFTQQANNTKAEAAVAHVETIAAVSVAKAAAMPPIDSNGQMTVEHSLDSTIALALSTGRLDVAEQTLTLRKNLTVKPKGDDNAA